MEKIKKYIPYIVLLLGSAALLVRARYSFCWSDETFYSSTAYRFMCGDRLFYDDWFPTQLSGVVLLPFMAVFKLVTGSMTGVILYLRILYVIASFAVSSVLFGVFNKDKNIYAAYAISIMMLFYTHLNIATFSYYMISVQCFIVAVTLIYHFNYSRKKSHLVIAGAVFAVSVLALPTMAAAYIVFMIGLFILRRVSFKLKNQSLKEKLDRMDIETMALYSFIGILIPAVIFFAFMLLNVSISEFIKGIPYVLSDEEHQTTFIFPLRKFFISINEVFHKGAYLAYLLICASLIVKKKFQKPIRCMMIFAADVLVFILNAYYAFGHTGYIQTALCLFGLPLYILTDKRDRKLFHTLYLGGLLFSLVYSYSSNGFLYVLSTGHAIADAASIVFIIDFCNETAADPESKEILRKAVKGVSAAVICWCLLVTVYLRFVNVYRDAPLKELTTVIDKGPAKGLLTTREHADMYTEVYETITGKCTREALGIPSDEDGYIFITKLLPFGYMCTDLRVAAPTCWRTSFDSDRLAQFYELNPEKLPDAVLVLDEKYGTYDTCGDVEYDPTPNANEFGGYLEELLDNGDYTCEKTACGTLYKK